MLSAIAMLASNCSKSNNNNPAPVPPAKGPVVNYWVTTGNQSKLLQQSAAIQFSTAFDNRATITVDSTRRYQTIDGFGYSLTGGSATLINQLPDAAKDNLLQELFGSGTNAIGVSYLRISIGASDLDPAVFSYDDLPAGQTDVNLDQFSIAKDLTDLIPVLKKILAINPNIKILGSPWSAPVWMKDNGNSMGGTLQQQYYPVYANYFVKYIQQMKANGIPVDAITIQNEPQHGGNNPSMVLSAAQEADFVKNHLGPAFHNAAITTKIIVWDHNCDNPNYPIDILNDAAAKPYVDGAAFHLYSGDISALSTVHNAHADKNLYFTEQWTGANGTFNGDLQWHVKNVIIGSMRNWSRNALEWNLASDPSYNPHTPGGCTECKGALTINGSSVQRNVSYYIIAHASKFVTPGSVRIESNNAGNFASAAFLRPDGKKVLIVVNDSNTDGNFNIQFNNQYVAAPLSAGAVATFVW